MAKKACNALQLFFYKKKQLFVELYFVQVVNPLCALASRTQCELAMNIC